MAQKPFNIDILIIAPEQLSHMRPVRSQAMFEGSSTTFHPDGLFSTLTFGKLGDPMRKLMFSYIDIKIPVLHPAVYKALGELKKIYVELMNGTGYAVWDAMAKDFVKVDATVGKTGYNFFMEHFTKLKFESRPSTDRLENIKLIELFKHRCLIDKVAVIPAGFRDVEFEEGSKISEDELNTYYRKLLGVANTILPGSLEAAPDLMNRHRMDLQRIFNELYRNILDRIDGKHQLFMGKFASRGVFNGTRNVLSAQDAAITYLGGVGETEYNHSMVGLYQAMAAYRPHAIFAIRNKYLPQIFSGSNEPANLIDPKTLKAKKVQLSDVIASMWTTNEGIDKVIRSYGLAGAGMDSSAAVNSIHNKPLMIAGHYAALIYKGKNGVFKVFHDIDALPTTYSKEDVHPITITEFMYCSVYDKIGDMPMFITRYPITGVGSIYPSLLRLISTVEYDKCYEIRKHWIKTDEESYLAPSFPKPNVALFQATAVNPAKWGGMGADIDGDTISANSGYSEDSREEVTDFLGTVSAYIGADGKFISSVTTKPSTLLFHNLTRGVRA